ncbi:hypothetical protein ACROYT_G038780 [Oculina patagonica]
MDVFVDYSCKDNSETGRTKLTVSDFDTTSIRNVKYAIQDAIQAPVCDQQLFYQGQPVTDDDMPLSRLYFREGDCFKLQFLAAADIPGMRELLDVLKNFAQEIVEKLNRQLPVSNHESLLKFHDLPDRLDSVGYAVQELADDYFHPWKCSRSVAQRHFFVQEGGFDAFLEVFKFSLQLYTVEHSEDHFNLNETSLEPAMILDQFKHHFNAEQLDLQLSCLSFLWAFSETPQDQRFLVSKDVFPLTVQPFLLQPLPREDTSHINFYMASRLIVEVNETALGCCAGFVEYDSNIQEEVSKMSPLIDKLLFMIDRCQSEPEGYSLFSSQVASNTLFYCTFNVKSAQPLVDCGALEKMINISKKLLTEDGNTPLRYYCCLFLARMRSAPLLTLDRDTCVAIDELIDAFLNRHVPSEITKWEEKHSFVWITMVPLVHLAFAAGKEYCCEQVNGLKGDISQTGATVVHEANSADMTDSQSTCSDTELFYDNIEEVLLRQTSCRPKGYLTIQTNQYFDSYAVRDASDIMKSANFVSGDKTCVMRDRQDQWPGSTSTQKLGIFSLVHMLSIKENQQLALSENLLPYLVCLSWHLKCDEREKLKTSLANFHNDSAPPSLKVIAKSVLAPCSWLRHGFQFMNSLVMHLSMLSPRNAFQIWSVPADYLELAGNCKPQAAQALYQITFGHKVPVASCRCYFCILSTQHKGSGVLDMNNIDKIIEVIHLSLIVARFLINTRRVPKAIELCKECLFILDNTPLITEEKKYKFLYKGIYLTMLQAYWNIGDHPKVTKYATKVLHILRECGGRLEECKINLILAALYLHQGKYMEVKKHSEKALLISTEIGDKNIEAFCYENLGAVYQSVGEYKKAKEYHMKALAISKEIGDRNGEACCYGKIGTVFECVGEYQKAKECHEKALKIEKEMGHRHGEACCYGQIGTVFECVGEYQKAKECHEKALKIKKEMGDTNGEAICYGNLGTVLKSLGEYEKAKEYLEVALGIKKGIGDREGEASCYGNLGRVFQSVGEYVKAKDYYQKAAAIARELGDKKGEGAACGRLGTVFISLGKYAKADECLQKALTISKEIGDKKGEAAVYGNLAAVFKSIGDFEKAREYLEKAVTITKKIGDKNSEASIYGNLGTIFEFLGDDVEAEEFHKKSLVISEEIGDVKKQSTCLSSLGCIMLLSGKIQEALSYLLPSIQKCEDLRGSLRDNDQFKISFSHEHADPYQVLGKFFCSTGNHNKALYVSELRRARALADLMSAQYSVENQISANPQSWVGIENVMDKELSCTCLYFSYFDHDIFVSILKARKLVQFKWVNGKEMIVHEGLIENLDDFFAKERFRSFSILPEEHCEDRSLNDIERKPSEEDIHTASQIRDDVKDNQDSLKRNLSLCHKLIIAPVAELMEGPEIIVVPERSLYNIPFAALPDESGKFLSETFRIRIVPSLTNLKLIQDSPADYHSQTGALIVGNPDVGRVRYKGRIKFILPLPCAESEANMIGEKLGVKPLLGKQATKQAVLQVINSMSLIHFAAHGDAERGEIALAPALRSSNRIPREDDYLLTMSDISKVQLCAKLVVLSCCHSGRGQIRTEGVVGIARTFLGSGARSVLVALWALEDSATEQFMSRFYEHLVGGNSASESLHEAMKWMRCNGYSEVRQWAPFMLIGDNVTFDFGKSK